jgi:hypothetical protein
LQGKRTGTTDQLGPSSFNFEASWLKEDGCSEQVQETWLNSFQTGASSVTDGLKEVCKTMFDWSRNILGGLEIWIKKLKTALAKCIKGTLSQENIQKEQVPKCRLERSKKIYIGCNVLMLIGWEKGTLTLPSSMRLPHREKGEIELKDCE